MAILQVIVNKRRHYILPLASYSPELNPIERTWANIKKYIRAVLPCSDNLTDILVDLNSQFSKSCNKSSTKVGTTSLAFPYMACLKAL